MLVKRVAINRACMLLPALKMVATRFGTGPGRSTVLSAPFAHSETTLFTWFRRLAAFCGEGVWSNASTMPEDGPVVALPIVKVM